jgi:hypothetical protein
MPLVIQLVDVPPVGLVPYVVQQSIWAPLRLLHRHINATCNLPTSTNSKDMRGQLLMAHLLNPIVGMLEEGKLQGDCRLL